jgi:hypothetical protein
MNPAPPEQLASAIRNALRDSPADPTAEDMLSAAERLLKNVLQSDCEARSSAITLLTVDALVTQAVLLATSDPNAPKDFANQAMRRLSAVSQ